MKQPKLYSFLTENEPIFKCFLFVLFVCSCVTQKKEVNQHPFDSLKAEDVKYIIIERYYNYDIHNSALVVDSAKRTYRTYDTIYSDMIKNEVIMALKDSHQETIKFAVNMTLILKRDLDDVRIGLMKNNIKADGRSFVCKKDIELLLDWRDGSAEHFSR